jgi:two-component system, chemotaxis family, protein-glutamate methylesterase/glutaminase
MSDIITLKVLIVDDSTMYRRIVQDVLESFPNVEIVGTAQNGKIALAKVAMLKPDLLTLDIEMPEMDGLEVLEHLRKEVPDTIAIVFSAYTTEGARITLRALELGAFDFISKPSAGKLEENRDRFKLAITPMLETLVRLKREKPVLKEIKLPEDVQRIAMPTIGPRNTEPSRVVAIGVSTGGPVALTKLIPKIPADIGIPIFIVQHMPPMFTEALARKLDSISGISVKEAADGELIQANTAYLAPGGKQMKVAKSAQGNLLVIRVTDDPPENNCKPSVDYLFRSISRHYGRYATGVIMTGMGFDGTEGLKMMKQRGAVVIAQNESSCAVYGMPRKPVEIGIVDVIAPLDSMAEEICRTIQ